MGTPKKVPLILGNPHVRCRFWPLFFLVSKVEDEEVYDLLCRSFLEKTGLDPAKISNVCIDGHTGAFASMQQHFSAARIHRDLQHVKQNIKDNET